MKKITLILLTILLTGHLSFASEVDTNKVYGVTIDAVNNLTAIVTALSNMTKKPTTRIVFDEWVPATEYQNAVNQIHNVSFIMGEILDSYYMNQYSLTQYTNRTTEYLNLLGDKVDIWEIGNEVNGEWLGTISGVVAKINAAYQIVKAQNKKTALTLYYNKVCYENASNEMFYWVNKNVSSQMRTGLDYVWISYYEDDCENYQPNWPKVFDSLHVLFPNSKIGIGECGTTTSSKKSEYIKRYYRMFVKTPNFVGGNFWWYFKQDCVPYTSQLWSVLNSATLGNKILPYTTSQPDNSFSVSNYPNPFNPVTRISYTIPENNLVTIKVYDNLGREISTLVNEIKQAGDYSVDFNGSSLSSGVYFYKINTGKLATTRQMLLVK